MTTTDDCRAVGHAPADGTQRTQSTQKAQRGVGIGPCVRRGAVALALVCFGCGGQRDSRQEGATRRPAVVTVGQWIWTRADAERYRESRAAMPALEAAVFIGSVRCDTVAHRLVAQAGLPPTVVTDARPSAVIRLEDGLYGCRRVSDSLIVFERQLDSAVQVLRRRGGAVAYATVQLDHDAPQRGLAAWAASVRYLRGHALTGDSVWVTSLIAHLREPRYGEWFGGVVSGHILQVFDTGELATIDRVQEAVRLTRRAGLPFRVGLGAFERQTRRGPTSHRAWFAELSKFARLPNFSGVWIFPAGQRWVTIFREAM